MNKPELINELEEITGLSRKEVKKLLADFENLVGERLGKGEKVMLSGFGVFEVTKRKKRKGINPRTKERIEIPEMKSIHFRPGLKLKRKIK